MDNFYIDEFTDTICPEIPCIIDNTGKKSTAKFIKISFDTRPDLNDGISSLINSDTELIILFIIILPLVFCF